jgi:hypothetical protein
MYSRTLPDCSFIRQPGCKLLTPHTRRELTKQVRQLAAVELRKRIASSDGRLWRKVNQDIRKQMKEDLLRRLTEEQVYVAILLCT